MEDYKLDFSKVNQSKLKDIGSEKHFQKYHTKDQRAQEKDATFYYYKRLK